MFEIVNNQVLKVEEVETKIQTAIVKTFYCYEKKIVFSSSKNIINADGVDFSFISFLWQRFDGLNGFMPDESQDSVLIDFAGIKQEIIPGEIVEFSTNIKGDHIIKSLCDMVENGEVVIVGE
ncbi:hypothetical protein [Dehalobacter restrictus]|uniref:Uncharacterized protein n=1 Tax=Dehalobacter restrictus TaxID=55583 RepID=A0A857DIU1_9FIRM|nr:hypothetical protein [Dehalobacter restrictus]QHA00528.1 hypothetical protein GQ588_07740 [Dehalobacter restrictus]